MNTLFKKLFFWFDNSFLEEKYASITSGKEIDWMRVIPFILLHLSCFFILIVGFSWTAFTVCITLFAIRMFAITGFYHRYFSHKTFRTSRFVQLLFAMIGATAVQRGPLWWAAHHRGHHIHSDTPEDKHSPQEHGFFWSHMGWFLTKSNFVTNTKFVRELIRFPELRIIDRFDLLMPLALSIALFFVGYYLNQYEPQLKTNGFQLLIWGFSVSTVMLYHATFLVNSVAHQWGKKRYETKDTSRNNFIIAILTFGEGWHNNHHHYPGSARQGFYWWEIDLTYYVLKFLAMIGIIWDIRTVSENIRESKKNRTSSSLAMKIAIIGSGISGNTLAYYLNPHHQIALFESNDRIGGHSHTHHIDVFNQKVSVDTGFIVFNKKTYPNFLKLLHELKVPYEKSAMSFSVKDSQKDFEYNGTSLNALFAQRKNFINPKFYKMIREILRFNKSSIILLSSNEEISLGDYLKREGYSDFFKKYYILPMGSAIWSSNIKTMMQFPAKFFIQFFNNHGMLNINDRPQWLTISGGSINYVNKMIEPFRKKIKINQNIKYVERKKDHIAIHHKDRIEKFDWVFFACHSDEALKLIKSPSFHEKNILKAIPYTDNEVILHYDDHFMPKRKLAWAAWNYHIDDNANSPASLTYNMNILQNLKTEVPLLVTLNPLQKINKKKIIKTLSYAHPQYSLRSIEAQSKYHLISGVNRTSFAGAYWGNGFHEDGVKSALDAIQQFNAVHGFL